MSEEMEFEAVIPKFWNPEKVEDQLTGVLIGKEIEVGMYSSNLYRFDTEGGILSVWGCTVLDSRLKHVEVGDVIRLTYKGKKKNDKTGRTFEDYTVEKGKKKKEVKPVVVEEKIAD